MRRWVVVALALCAGCGTESKLRLDPDDDDGVPPVTTADPPGGSFRELPPEIRLESDEPATIFFTLDGSTPTTASASEASPVLLTQLPPDTTVRFFAVDAHENAEAEHSESYLLDVDAPPRVQPFTLALSGSDASLTWTNPVATDFAGVLVARSHGVLADPIPGATYEAGAVISTGTEVVFTGTGEAFDDADLAPGLWRYGAWSFDTLRNYSAISVASANVKPPPQFAAVTVTVAALTATVTTPSALLQLSAGTPVYTAGTMTLDVPLTITNALTRPAYNPKLVVSSVSGGAFSNADPGLVDGLPQRWFGPGVAPGSGSTRTLTFTGVAAAATVVINVRVADSPHVLFPQWGGINGMGAGDGDSGQMTQAVPASAGAFGNGGDASYNAVALTPDGRYALTGARMRPRIDRVDLTTLQAVAGVSAAFSNVKASIGSIVLDASGKTLYAVLNDGHCGYHDSSDPHDGVVRVLRFDAETLVETARVTLSPPPAHTLRGRRMALSPDGTTLAVPVVDYDGGSAWLAFVNTSDFIEVDTDSSADGVQARLTSPAFGASEVEFSLDGTTLYANDTWPFGRDEVSVIDLTDGEFTTVPMPMTLPVSLVVADDGRLFIGSDSTVPGVRIFDPSSGLTTHPGTAGNTTLGVSLTPRGTLLIRNSNAGQTEHDLTTGAVVKSWATPGFSTVGNWVVMTPY